GDDDQVAHDVLLDGRLAARSRPGGPSIRPAPALDRDTRRGRRARPGGRYPCPVTAPGAIPNQFRAFVAEKVDERVERGVRTVTAADLPTGEVEVQVSWSSVNYKDALATIPTGKVARISPLIPGIDLA